MKYRLVGAPGLEPANTRLENLFRGYRFSLGNWRYRRVAVVLATGVDGPYRAFAVRAVPQMSHDSEWHFGREDQS
jgi:hypothetical protein